METKIYLAHSVKGSTWKIHKYVSKKKGKSGKNIYTYPKDESSAHTWAEWIEDNDVMNGAKLLDPSSNKWLIVKTGKSWFDRKFISENSMGNKSWTIVEVQIGALHQLINRGKTFINNLFS